MARTIENIRQTLDKQSDIAIWYTRYNDNTEVIQYTNACFAGVFGLSIDQILEKQRYHLVNPPETSAETIEQYKNEDRQGCLSLQHNNLWHKILFPTLFGSLVKVC